MVDELLTQAEIDVLSKTLQHQAVLEYARDIVLKSYIHEAITCDHCGNGKKDTAGVYEVGQVNTFLSLDEALSRLPGVRHAHIDGAYLCLSFKDRQVAWMVRPVYNGNRWERTADGSFRPPRDWREKYYLPGDEL